MEAIERQANESALGDPRTIVLSDLALPLGTRRNGNNGTRSIGPVDSRSACAADGDLANVGWRSLPTCEVA